MRKFKLIKEYPGYINKLGIEESCNNPNIISGKYDQKQFWEEIIEKPEYVKCIEKHCQNKNYTVTKIYKVSENNDFVIGNDSKIKDRWLATWNNTKVIKFESSTKEAYDLQEKAKFIIGKWYKNLDISKAWMCKCEGFFNDDLKKMKSSEYITDKNEYRFYKNTYLQIQDETVEATLEEIQQYLPYNHVDKIKSQLDYEILSFKSLVTTYKNTNIIVYNNVTKCYDWDIEECKNQSKSTLDNFINNDNFKIHSVKRLSDGE